MTMSGQYVTFEFARIIEPWDYRMNNGTLNETMINCTGNLFTANPEGKFMN